jgi:hypothetical protein
MENTALASSGWAADETLLEYGKDMSNGLLGI